MTQATQRLVLASGSPRRLALLGQIGVVPDTIAPPDIDEMPRPRELPRDLALRLAGEKATHIAAQHPEDLVLAADTVVACGRRILSKAETEKEASACLALLSGRRHVVYSAVVLAGANGLRRQRLVPTRVAFKRLSQEEIRRYLASGEWHGKAGGYAIQGLAAAFIRFLNGSYSGVVGLPLFETAQLLAGSGYPVGAHCGPSA